jgi:AraC-like DNA-binding protein
MQASLLSRAVPLDAIGRGSSSSSRPSTVAALQLFECVRDAPRVALPRVEIQIVARFGPGAAGGLDVHAFGAHERVHRKVLKAGWRTVTARLRLGTADAVLGVPASQLAGRIAALEELWGDDGVQELRGLLAAAHDAGAAAAVLENAIRGRLTAAHGAGTELALAAAERLAFANVNHVATDLGVSARHLRRVFHETVGVSPKTFAKLTRFRRALRAARSDPSVSWAGIAADAGYYDQAHLIAEFRSIAGVTPRALLAELRAT